MKENNSKERRFYVKIRFQKDNNSTLEVAYFKNDMEFKFFIRWKWYFEYRAALLRVQNPHSFIELTHGGYEYILPEEIYKKKVYNLLVAAKRMRTQFERQIDYVRKNWDQLFPPEEHPKWIKVMEKLKMYEERVKQLSNEYESI